MCEMHGRNTHACSIIHVPSISIDTPAPMFSGHLEIEKDRDFQRRTKCKPKKKALLISDIYSGSTSSGGNLPRSTYTHRSNNHSMRKRMYEDEDENKPTFGPSSRRGAPRRVTLLSLVAMFLEEPQTIVTSQQNRTNERDCNFCFWFDENRNQLIFSQLFCYYTLPRGCVG